MLYNSVSPEQMQLLVKQHTKDCLDRFMADQMSAPMMDHQLSNITHARFFPSSRKIPCVGRMAALRINSTMCL